jgi:methionyl aminopeptidase
MSISSVADWAGLVEAGRITKLALDALEAGVRAGVTTGELDAIAAELLDKQGARSAPKLVYGFPGTVLISVNDEVVHGVPGARRLERSDLVKLDVTIEKDGYIADAARTVVVGGGSELAERLAVAARAAFDAGLAVARAGTRVNQIGRAVSKETRRRGFTVVRGLSGHGVGRTIHEPPDVPNSYDPFQRDVLTDGLVITIEPMISAGAAATKNDRNGWAIRTADGSLAAHFEHTIVITRAQPVLLTA